MYCVVYCLLENNMEGGHRETGRIYVRFILISQRVGLNMFVVFCSPVTLLQLSGPLKSFHQLGSQNGKSYQAVSQF
jgi:hypothetical protein